MSISMSVTFAMMACVSCTSAYSNGDAGDTGDSNFMYQIAYEAEAGRSDRGRQDPAVFSNRVRAETEDARESSQPKEEADDPLKTWYDADASREREEQSNAESENQADQSELDVTPEPEGYVPEGAEMLGGGFDFDLTSVPSEQAPAPAAVHAGSKTPTMQESTAIEGKEHAVGQDAVSVVTAVEHAQADETKATRALEVLTAKPHVAEKALTAKPKDVQPTVANVETAIFAWESKLLHKILDLSRGMLLFFTVVLAIMGIGANEVLTYRRRKFQALPGKALDTAKDCGAQDASSLSEFPIEKMA